MCQWTLCTSWYQPQSDARTPSCCPCPRLPTPSPSHQDTSWSKTWWDHDANALDANAIPKLRLIDSLVSPQVKTGFVMNILGILSVTLAVNTWGVAMFDLHTYPEWAHPPNNSAAAVVQALNATLWSLTETKGPRSVWRLVTERGLQSCRETSTPCRSGSFSFHLLWHFSQVSSLGSRVSRFHSEQVVLFTAF